MSSIMAFMAWLVSWVEQNPSVAVPAMIAAAGVILASTVKAISSFFGTVIKAMADIVVAWLSRRNGKGDPQRRKPKSPFR